MKYAKLGNTDLNVSRICMGCMGFGDATRGQHSWTIDEEHSREIIKRGLDLGVNFYDTAIAYQSGTIAIHRKLVNRNADEFYSIDCLAERFGTTREYIENLIDYYRKSGKCTLFV